MMRRLVRDKHGATALEFTMIALPFFFVMFGIIDVGRYAITMHSLRTLASTAARQVMISCYGPNVIKSISPSSCTGDPLTDTQKQTAAPFLYIGGLTPTVTVEVSGSTLVVTASQLAFSMLLPALSGLDNPSASVAIPY
jgi:TadE-like protein